MPTTTLPSRYRRDALLVEWQDDVRPALSLLKRRALELAETADRILCQRQLGYAKDRNDKLRDYVGEHLAATRDLLSDLHGCILRDADEAGLQADLLPFDLADLDEEIARWI